MKPYKFKVFPIRLTMTSRCWLIVLFLFINCVARSPHHNPQAIITTVRGKFEVTLELALTPEQKTRGLMFREKMPQRHGMLFVWEKDLFLPFWMKDTPSSLDIIFIDAGGHVVSIIPDTIPRSTETLWPTKSYRYVLEVGAGFVEESELTLGDKIQLHIQ